MLRPGITGWGSCGTARTPALLPGGLCLSDYLSVGAIARVFPRGSIPEALRATGRESLRRPELPAKLMVYCVIAMPLFRQASTREALRCLMEGKRGLSPEPVVCAHRDQCPGAPGLVRRGRCRNQRRPRRIGTPRAIPEQRDENPHKFFPNIGCVPNILQSTGSRATPVELPCVIVCLPTHMRS